MTDTTTHPETLLDVFTRIGNTFRAAAAHQRTLSKALATDFQALVADFSELLTFGDHLTAPLHPDADTWDQMHQEHLEDTRALLGRLQEALSQGGLDLPTLMARQVELDTGPTAAGGTKNRQAVSNMCTTLGLPAGTPARSAFASVQVRNMPEDELAERTTIDEPDPSFGRQLRDLNVTVPQAVRDELRGKARAMQSVKSRPATSAEGNIAHGLVQITYLHEHQRNTVLTDTQLNSVDPTILADLRFPQFRGLADDSLPPQLRRARRALKSSKVNGGYFKPDICDFHTGDVWEIKPASQHREGLQQLLLHALLPLNTEFNDADPTGPPGISHAATAVAMANSMSLNGGFDPPVVADEPIFMPGLGSQRRGKRWQPPMFYFWSSNTMFVVYSPVPGIVLYQVVEGEFCKGIPENKWWRRVALAGIAVMTGVLIHLALKERALEHDFERIIEAIGDGTHNVVDLIGDIRKAAPAGGEDP
ncbi:hypothetical protein [Terrabacter sp. RAF57]|uniref:hypothetical protein n=1 Tax=Terrabacter sp. RAF57 TaxID=3233063 RepID=UPI003F9C96AF